MDGATTAWTCRPRASRSTCPRRACIPVLNAAGLATAIVGITISMILVVAGLLLFFGTAIVWIRDARREMEELPLEHHH